MTLPEIDWRGTLVNEKADDVLSLMAARETEYTGDDQSIGWTLTIVKGNDVSINDAADGVANLNHGLTPGWYLVLVNTDGLTWGFFYGGKVGTWDRSPATMNQDFERAQQVFDTYCEGMELA